jgi:hypothetical protein
MTIVSSIHDHRASPPSPNPSLEQAVGIIGPVNTGQRCVEIVQHVEKDGHVFLIGLLS